MVALNVEAHGQLNPHCARSSIIILADNKQTAVQSDAHTLRIVLCVLNIFAAAAQKGRACQVCLLSYLPCA